MEKTFKFLEPGELVDDDLELYLKQKVPANEKKGYCPAYWFEMRNSKTAEKIGEITLRVGDNENIHYGGNLGYGVEEKFRGNHYASCSCKLLFPFAKKNGLKSLLITCNPENTASRKTCEAIGGVLVDIVDLPKHDQQYKRGERKKCRYKIEL